MVIHVRSWSCISCCCLLQPLFARLFPNTASEQDLQLGTDAVFICAFLVAFVFSWLGALAALCVSQSVAGRLGAMSGFGLNLVKLIAIMKVRALQKIIQGLRVLTNISFILFFCL